MHIGSRLNCATNRWLEYSGRGCWDTNNLFRGKSTWLQLNDYMKLSSFGKFNIYAHVEWMCVGHMQESNGLLAKGQWDSSWDSNLLHYIHCLAAYWWNALERVIKPEAKSVSQSIIPKTWRVPTPYSFYDMSATCDIVYYWLQRRTESWNGTSYAEHLAWRMLNLPTIDILFNTFAQNSKLFGHVQNYLSFIWGCTCKVSMSVLKVMDCKEIVTELTNVQKQLSKIFWSHYAA